MRYFLAILSLCCFSCSAVFAQEKKLPLTFSLRYGKDSLRIGQQYASGKNTLQVQTLRFYISDLELYDGNKMQWKELNSYHLIDAAIPNSLQLPLTVPPDIRFSAISFRLGIDSITNVSGALGGDLDPSKGMYWTWQSGYINFKIEGTSPTCKTRDNEFQFHLGGYAGAQASSQTIKLNTKQTDAVTIIADIATFFGNCDLAIQNTIIIPGLQAVDLSRKAAAIFSIRQ